MIINLHLHNRQELVPRTYFVWTVGMSIIKKETVVLGKVDESTNGVTGDHNRSRITMELTFKE